jgi:hypothetical protein
MRRVGVHRYYQQLRRIVCVKSSGVDMARNIYGEVLNVPFEPEAQQGIYFVASLPAIQGAIKIGGDGATRLTLELPESEREAVKHLLDCGGKVLNVMVQVEQGGGE